MLNRRALKAELVRNGITQTEMAEMLGMTSKTFYNKMRTGKFGIQDAEKMIKILKIDQPMLIFFNQKVTSQDTYK